jgi:hypothetical protein
MKISLIFATVLTLPFSSTFASEYTANKLYQDCTGVPGSAPVLGCAAYIAGFVDGLLVGVPLAETKFSFCPPKDFNGLQARLLFEKFIRDHPKALSMTASMAATAAMTDAYPCHPKNSN